MNWTRLVFAGWLVCLMGFLLTGCLYESTGPINAKSEQEKTKKWLNDGNITNFKTETADCYVYRGFGISCVKNEKN